MIILVFPESSWVLSRNTRTSALIILGIPSIDFLILFMRVSSIFSTSLSSMDPPL